MTELKNLASVSPEELYTAFNEAFKDYERHWSRSEFDIALQRNGFIPELSFGAFEEGQLISLTLNATGIYNNKLTAYDTGTGTIKEYRGQKLATQIFQYSLPYLKEAGCSQYLLEVLQKNAPAIAVYSTIGFRVSREFNYFVKPVADIQIPEKALPKGYELKETEPDREAMTAMWDVQPSWQNNFAAIDRRQTNFKIIGAFYDDKLIGYGIIEPGSGDITQLAIDKAHRRKGIATTLLKELARLNKHSSMKIINTEVTCTAMNALLASCNIEISGKQFEMILEIR